MSCIKPAFCFIETQRPQGQAREQRLAVPSTFPSANFIINILIVFSAGIQVRQTKSAHVPVHKRT